MKITGLETYLVELGERNMPLVRVLTDEGIHGIGEAFAVGPDLATVKAIEYYADWLIGRNPLDIEGLWQFMYNGSRFPGGSLINAAISGIEHALWDIKGKFYGAPVYELIGGKCRDKVRVYQGVGGGSPEATAENAVRLVETYGYTALKMGPHPQGNGLWHDMGLSEWLNGVEAKMRAVREAVGHGVDIGLDSHAQVFEPFKAVAMCHVLEPYRPLFLEEPLRPENRKAFGYLRGKSSIPIATGESMYTKFEFRDLLANEGADILQPDVTVVGGLWEMKKIAFMAEADYVTVAPHNPCGPVANAVNMHFAMSTQNFLVLEYRPDDIPARTELVDAPIPLVDGYLIPPDRPGLGLDLNLEACSKHEYKAWHRPFLWRIDGSFGYQ